MAAHSASLLILFTFSLQQSSIAAFEQNLLTIFPAKRPYKLHMIKTGLQMEELDEEIANLSSRHSVKAVAFTNDAKDWLRLFCSSEFEQVFQDQRMDVGESVIFEFEPITLDKAIVFQCGLDYKLYFAIWDAVNEILPSTKETEVGQLKHYLIRHDGIYINEKKIQGLVSDENSYVLCKENNVKQHYPDCLPGYVDNGMCNNLPGWILNKVWTAYVLNFGCIILYDGYNCFGKSKKIRSTSPEGKRDFLEDFKNKTTSVKGCTF